LQVVVRDIRHGDDRAGWVTEELWFDSRQGTRFSSSPVFKPVVGANQPRISTPEGKAAET
jgi:hypothetical protein